MTKVAYALLIVYALSTLLAAMHVYRALRCCNGLGECGRCTPTRWTCAMLRSFAVPPAMVVALTTLWPLTTGSAGDRARRLLDGLPRLWGVVTALAVRHACCDASTGAHVAFVEYADQHVHVPRVTRLVLGDDQ